MTTWQPIVIRSLSDKTPSASIHHEYIWFCVCVYTVPMMSDYNTWHTYNNVVITIAIRLRSDYDVSRAPASIRREQKNEHVNFSS